MKKRVLLDPTYIALCVDIPGYTLYRELKENKHTGELEPDRYFVGEKSGLTSDFYYVSSVNIKYVPATLDVRLFYTNIVDCLKLRGVYKNPEEWEDMKLRAVLFRSLDNYQDYCLTRFSASCDIEEITQNVTKRVDRNKIQIDDYIEKVTTASKRKTRRRVGS